MMTDELFLTALNGKALYAGDKVFSAHHNQIKTVTSIFIDCDDDVYLCFYGGGNALMSSCAKLKPHVRVLHPLVPEVEHFITLDKEETAISLGKKLKIASAVVLKVWRENSLPNCIRTDTTIIPHQHCVMIAKHFDIEAVVMLSAG